MSNVSIAKNKVKQLTSRTEKDLYRLSYDTMDFMPLNNDTFVKVKMVCNDNNLPCPLYRYAGDIKFKNFDNGLYSVLDTLAKEYQVYLDYSNVG